MPSPPNDRKLIIVTLEGLVPGSLGCYGSSWTSTPAIDSLAAGGCVWDHFIAPSDDPLEVIRRWLIGDDGSIVQLSDPIGPTELVTDDPRLIELGLNECFDQTLLIDSLNSLAEQPAEGIELSAFGQLVAAALDRADQNDWGLLWAHSRFLTRCWDAPRDLPAEEDSDEDGSLERLPAVFQQTTPPAEKVGEAADPDLTTTWMTTYGQQIQMVDDLIGVMLESLREPDAIVVLAGTSGFSLGQNGWIGHRVGPLRSCHTRLPLVVGSSGPIRCPAITCADEFRALVRQLMDQGQSLIDPAVWAAPWNEFDPRLVTHGHGQSAVTTPRWFLVNESEQSQRLFLKPDDVEDFNDVSRLRPDVVDQLSH